MLIKPLALLVGSFIAVAASAQDASGGNPPDHGRAFGLGAPSTLDELPPGRTTARLKALPPAAQERALDWLRRFSFPIEDIEKIRSDAEGALYYRDDALSSDLSAATVDEPLLPSGALTAQDAFSLHSRPGAARVVYLDFDGHEITGRAWNGGGGTLYARSYDLDGNPTAFGQAELDSIAEIWHRLAEDLAPFDVDVTTEAPATYTSTTGHILITRDDDEGGLPMPSAGAGGVAYVNVWGRTGTYDYEYYSPALVYYDNLGNGQPRYVAEAAAHELGHNLALSHDGTSSVSYYSGHNAGPSGGYIDWAPIMGNSYGADVSQWSRGDYADANNQQDDLFEIASRLGYRADDHSDSSTSATLLLVDGAGNVSSTNPELDPYNDVPGNKGVIERNTDVDYFVVSLANGVVDLSVRPAWDAYYHEASRGANLDIYAALYDVSGALVAESDPATGTDSHLVATVSTGTYYLMVTGVGAGDAVTAYNDYASLGQYFIYGTVPVGSPNSPPIAADDNGSVPEDGQVVLSVLVNDGDAEGDVLSIVAATQPDHGSVTINASTITYTPNVNYYGNDAFTYTITDGFSAVSASVSVAVNPVNDPPVAQDDAVSTPGDVETSVEVLANDSDVDGDALSVAVASQPGNGNASVQGSTIVYVPNPGFFGVDVLHYTVSDGAGGTATASVAVTVTEVVSLPEATEITSVADTGNGAATVSWSASVGADGYEIRRETKHKKRDAWNGLTTVGSPGPGVLSLVDASGSGTFRYQVRAVNDAGASSWSDWVQVTVSDTSGGGGRGGGGGKGRAK